MNPLKLLSMIAIVVFAWTLHAKTAQQRMTELSSLLPPGSTMRAVWVQGSAIKAMSSSDGAIFDLVTGTDLWMPNLTHDGTKVIYGDLREGAAYVINWDKTGKRKICDNGEALRYRFDPNTRSEFALVVDADAAYAVNINASSQRTLLWNQGYTDTKWGWTYLNTMDYTPFTLSPDGTHLAGHFPHPRCGVAVVPNGHPVIVDTQSCYATIAPDNSYDVLFQNSGHDTAKVRSATGALVQTVPVSDTVISWATKNNYMNGQDSQRKYEDMRWGNNREYIVFHMWATKGNPWVMRVADRKFMYFDDVAYSSAGSTRTPDIVILDASTIMKKNSSEASKIVMSIPQVTAYQIDGRRLTKGKSSGIVLMYDRSVGIARMHMVSR